MLTTIAGIALEVSWFVVRTTSGLIYNAVWSSTNALEESAEQKELHRLESLAVSNAESLHRIEEEMLMLRQSVSKTDKKTDIQQCDKKDSTISDRATKVDQLKTPK